MLIRCDVKTGDLEWSDKQIQLVKWSDLLTVGEGVLTAKILGVQVLCRQIHYAILEVFANRGCAHVIVAKAFFL